MTCSTPMNILLSTRIRLSALRAPMPTTLWSLARFQRWNGPRTLLGLRERGFQAHQMDRHRLHSTASSALKKTNDAHSEVSAAAAETVICLPWPNLLRSYVITWITSSPILLKPCLSILACFAKSKIRLFNPESNRVLHAVLKKTFYAHFCAGETPEEVRQTIINLKSMGYRGVMMGHAREEVLSREEKALLDSLPNSPEQEELNSRDIQRWKQNTLATLELTQEGDFVALKFTGAGKQALKHLKQTKSCVPELGEAIDEVCQSAQERGVGLLFDAEQAFIQPGIEDWTMYYMKRYNKGERAVVYATYQTYARRTPSVLSKHLDEARKYNIVLGVKLVRGAYLGSDPRQLFWDSIEKTHDCYDNIARCMIERRYDGILKPVDGNADQFPRVDFVLASHNAESVRQARKLRDQQALTGTPRIPMAYGQLMGMADHVSGELLQEANARSSKPTPNTEIPQAYKYVVWGTMGECMKYLLRRGQENRDAVSRTLEARQALGNEIVRRIRLVGA